MNIRGSWWYFGTVMEPVVEHHIFRRDPGQGSDEQGTLAIRIPEERVAGNELLIDFIVEDSTLTDGPSPPGVQRSDVLTPALAAYIIRMTLMKALLPVYADRVNSVRYRDTQTGFEEVKPV